MSQDTNLILQRVLRSGRDEDAHLLLQGFFDGYPVENLLRIFSCSDDRVVKIGAWIASELGTKAATLKSSFLPLLEHRSRYVRFFVLDAVLVCATEQDQSLVARAIQMLRDCDAAVRWKALVFVAKAPLSVLTASSGSQADEHLAKLTSWISNLDGINGVARVTDRLNSLDGMNRLVAGAGAYRLYDIEPKLLELAGQSEDAEVASFAQEQLRLLR